MVSAYVRIFFCAVLFAAAAGTEFAQSAAPERTPAESFRAKAESKNSKKSGNAKGQILLTAEGVAESSLIVYGFPKGRETLDQIRRTSTERGTLTVTGADGKSEKAAYQRWQIRGADTSKDKTRLDQDFPNARYALVSNDDKVFGIYNEQSFVPREDAARAFVNQTVYGLDALLRYKENGSTLTLVGRDKIMGVDYNVVEVTDKTGRKTRFYVSAKTFRVMMLEYEDGGVKYKRKFYNYNYAQGTLVPYRSVLYADGKIIEESEIATVTYGQKVDEAMFAAK